MRERWCAACSRHRSADLFRVVGGKPARDCNDCAKTRRARNAQINEEKAMAGVDIDRIHHKLGAVKKGVYPR